MTDYESIAGYSSSNNGYSSDNAGYSSEDVGFSVDTVNTKQANLARIAAEKKTALIPLSTVRHNDADTFNTPNSNIRLDGLSNGAGVDSWEVPHAGKARPAKLDLQREALANLTGLPVSRITDQDVYEFGNKSNEYVKSILRKGQEGVANPQVAITTSDELDKFNRKLANVSNPVTGEDLATALNNPLHNAGYDAFYNKSKKAADAYNPDRTSGELASDSLKSLAGKGTLGLSTLLAGAIDLPARAVGEALYRAGINDSTWSPNDATGLYEKINDAKSQINQSMSPTLKKEIALLDEKISTRDATRDFRTRKTAEQLGASETVKDFVIAPMKWGADVARDITDGLIDHPAAAVDMLLENVVTMGVSGAAAKTGVKALVAKTAQTAATEAKILAAANPTASSVTTANALSNVAEEATKLAAKSGELKSLATMSAQEVTGNTGETLSGVMNTPINELRATSPDFRTAEKLFIAQGMSPEEAASKAQLQIANDSANVVAAMTAITAPLAAKLTGASKFESNLFNKTGVVGKAVGGLRAELPEETLQGFSGQLASNIADQTYVDPSTKLSEGLSGATAKSALTGGLMGATIPAAIDTSLKASQAVGTTGQVVSKATSAISNAYKAVTTSQEVNTINDEIKVANTTGDYTKVVTSDKVTSTDLVSSLIESPPVNAEKSIQDNYFNKLREHTISLQSDLIDLADKTENLTDAELALPENIALAEKRDAMTELFYQSKGLLDTRKVTNADEVATRIAEIPAGTEIDTRTLGSILPKSTEAQLDTLAKLVPEDSIQAEMIANRREVLISEKSAQNVSTEVREGGTITNKAGVSTPVLGYLQHQEAVQDAVDASNPTAATKALDRFKKFSNGLVQKAAVYETAANLITSAETNRTKAISKATADTRANVIAEQNALVARAIVEANGMFASAGILTAKGEAVNYPNAKLIQSTQARIQQDINAVNAAVKESEYIVGTVTSRSKYEAAIINKVAKTKGIAGLEAIKARKEAALTKADIQPETASQLNAEIKYIDKLLANRVPAVEPVADKVAEQPDTSTQAVAEDTSVQVTEPVAVVPKAKKAKRKTEKSLQTTLKDLGGINISDLRDITGETKRSNLRSYKNAFTSTGKSLMYYIESGLLDDYITPGLRLEDNTNSDEAYDATEAYNELADMIKNGEKIIPYFARLELTQLNYENSFIEDVSNILTEEEINDQLLQETQEQSRSNSDAGITVTSNTKGSIESSTRDEVSTENISIVESVEEVKPTLVTKLKAYTNDLVKLFSIKATSNVIANDSAYFDTVPAEYKDSKEFAKIATFVKSFNKAIDNSVKLKGAFGANLTNLLADNTGKLPQEIKNLMSVATYEWMLKLGTGSVSNGKYEIAQMMGISEEEITPAMEYYLTNIGTLRGTAAKTIGKQVLREAGITSNTLDVAENVFENLASEIGLHSLNTLVQIKTKTEDELRLAEYNALTLAQMNALLDGLSIEEVGALAAPTKDNMAGGSVFIGLGAVADAELGIVANRIVDKLVKDGSTTIKILNDIQKKEDGRPAHTIDKPTIKSISKYMKGTIQKVPEKALEIAVKYMQQENYVDVANFEIFNKLHEQFQREMLGYVEAVDGVLPVVQPLIKQTQSINSGIVNAIRKLNEFAITHAQTEQGLATPFYLHSEFWKQMRLGMTSSTIDTQNIKLHRALITRDKPYTVSYKDNASRQYHARALAQAFGVKTDNLDPFNMPVSIEELISVEDYSVFEAAAKAMNESNTAKFTDAQSKAIVEAVKHGGEGMHTYSGIVALAKEMKALEEGSASFDTTLIFEVDGKTNGPVIALLQLAGAKNLDELKGMMARGGMFTDGVTRSYYDYQSKVGNLDTYEAFATVWQKTLSALTAEFKPVQAKAFASLERILGSLNDPKKGRKLAKPPVTKNAFGSATFSTTKSFVSESLETLYSKINDNQTDFEGKLVEIAADIKVITGITHTFTKENVLSALPRKIENAYKKAVEATYGEALTQALDEAYKDLNDKRLMLNTAMQLAFKALKYQYDTKVEAYIAENAAKANPITGITKAQRDSILADIQGVSPVIKSYFSQSVEDSIVAYKDAKATVDKKAYTGQANTNAPMTIHGLNGSSFTVLSSTTVAALDYVEDPGVAAAIQMVHSLDSATMLLALEELIDAGTPALNIFDAIITVAPNVVDSSAALNKAFEQVMREYNMVSEFYDSYAQVMSALPKSELAKINAELRSKPAMKIFKDLSTFTKYFKNTVAEVTDMKDSFLKEMTFNTQYVGVPVNPVNEYDTEVSSAEGTTLSDAEVKQFATESEAAINEAVVEAKKATDEDTLGSSQDGIDPNAFQSDLDIRLTEANIVNNVMEQLGKKSLLSNVHNNIDSKQHKDYLVEWVASMAANLSPSIKQLMLRTRKVAGITAGAISGNTVMLEAGDSPVANLRSKSAQEVFAHELTHAVTRYGLEHDSLLRNQVERLRDRVLNYLLKQPNPLEHFLKYDSAGNIQTVNGNTEQQEIAAAQEEFDYIFGLDGSGKSWSGKAAITNMKTKEHNNNSLYEFIAFGKTNSSFMDLLGSQEMNTVLKKEFSASVWDKNVFIMIGNIFNKLMGIAVGKITASTALDADKQLNILIDKLTKVVNRNDPQFQEQSGIDVRTTNKAINKLQKMLVATAFVAANSKVVKNSKNTAVVAAGKVTKVIQYLPYDTFRTWSKNVARRIGISDRNFAVALLREVVRGRTKDNSYLYNLISAYKHGVDQARNDIHVRAVQNLMAAFTTTKLSNSEKTVLLKTFLKLDLHIVVEEFGIGGLQNALISPAKRNELITKLETELKAITSDATFNHHSKMAKSLGSRISVGTGTEVLDHLNAFSIVNHHPGKYAANLPEAERIVDLLASLHGIGFTDPAYLVTANSIIVNEYAKTGDLLTEDGENGIQYLMEYHKDLKQRALTELFQGQKSLIVKGFTKELYDPKIQFQVATAADAVAQRYEGKGYVYTLPIKKDNAHTTLQSPLGLYVNKFGGLSSRLSTAISVMEDVSKGALITDMSVYDIQKAYRTSVAAQYTNKKSVPPNSSMTPVRNNDGVIVGFRYMMDEKTKDLLLNKNNSFEQVMGAMDADLTVKPAAKEINTTAIKAMYKDYKANYMKDPKAYVAIGPRSTDTELAEIYKLLPDEVKQTIKDSWGTDTMYIREQDVRLAFGYRKFSLANFDKQWTPAQKASASVVGKVGMKIAEMLNSKLVLRSHNVWEFIVKTAKDTVVIKTGAVMVANIVSNNAVLYSKGLSIPMIYRYQAEAIDNFNKYQKDYNTQKNIEMRIRLNPSLKTNKVVMGRLSNAKSALTNNPVKALLDAGVFQSIIEDVEVDNAFSYRTITEEFVSPVTNKIPQPLKTFGNVLILSHDTRLYKALKVTTQMSDFVARYALHKFNMDQKNKDGSNKFSEEKSIEDVNDTFILYDVPTSPEMQALNDSGILMFTKYAFRIKKVLFNTAMRAPGRVVNSILFSKFVLGTANMYDSTFTLPGMQDPLDIADTATDISLIELVQNIFDGNSNSVYTGE